MLIAGYNPPSSSLSSGPLSLSLMTGLFDDDHDRPHSDDDDDGWTFCPQWTSLPIPTMLAPRIEPTAVHMPGLFRKLCERSFGTMEEEEDEVGKVGKVG